MLVCCFYSSLRDETAEAIAQFAPETEFVYTEGLYGYPEELAARWDTGEVLVTIEGDKIITADVLPSFEKCDRDWCNFSSPIFPPPFSVECSTGLGCTKFSVNLQSQISISELLRADRSPIECRECPNYRGCWKHLDNRINVAIAMLDQGIEVHDHGHIEHLHDYTDWRTKEMLSARELIAVGENSLAGPAWDYPEDPNHMMVVYWKSYS